MSFSALIRRASTPRIPTSGACADLSLGYSIRDDREASKEAVSIKWQGGKGNMIVENLFANKVDIADGVGRAAGNYDGK